MRRREFLSGAFAAMSAPSAAGAAVFAGSKFPQQTDSPRCAIRAGQRVRFRRTDMG